MPRLPRACVALAVVAVGCVPRERPKRESSGAPAAPANAALPPAGGALEQGSPPAPSSEALRVAFFDDYQRAALGPAYAALSPVWRIEEGRLCGRGARNRPVWLRRIMPINARIEFEATSYSPEGDIKVEVWGSGRSAATTSSYNDATSYLVIFGGWKNSLHVLARLDEHAPDRREIKLLPGSADFVRRTVAPAQTYRFRIERSDGKTVGWWVDDTPILRFEDSEPLAGVGHDHFGFNDWNAKVCFDNLRITPLPD